MHGKCLFTALDICDGYNNIQIHPVNQWKLAFKGSDGYYNPEVIFFRISNALAIFQRTMDKIFAPLKQRYSGCIFTYINNILIATGDDELLHEEIVHVVLNMLAEQDFFLKLSKCIFYQQSIDYLGI